ncbi:DUF2252 domain-containing protein [Microcella sp.]|uniref:DUF2252 domain-containing protein n=1 Tax=Microcella sp. TaxID=1913979 RepID=UPI00391BB0FA
MTATDYLDPSAHGRERGRALRREVPRASLAEVYSPRDRDPIAILTEQNATRLPDLVPVRIGRMLQSPFAFYRGTAAVMAADLRDAPTTNLDVVACGDAHISNFGFYASPERELVFDLNDFDEGGVAPWEWDVRRLTASVYIGGRDIGLSDDTCQAAAHDAAAMYQTVLRRFCRLSPTERYFARVDSSRVAREFEAVGTRTVKRAAKKARGRTAERVLATLTTTTTDGRLRIDDQPPILQHVDHASLDELGELRTHYRHTLRDDIAYLLGQYTLVDYALRVVGVGSVGTRCYLIALESAAGDVLFLQAKEAPPSVLTTYGGRPALIPGRSASTDYSEGHRVVAAQRILQSTSDPFVGWVNGWAGDDAGRRRVDYYWRQFRDMKGSIDPATLNAAQYTRYAELCAGLLARAHGQSPASASIVGYLGRSGAFADAIATWSARYADVAEADYEALHKAVAAGRLPAETGV